MTCLVKTGSCIELRVSRGNSASLLYLALACNTAWCQTDHSQEDWPSSLAPGKKEKKKKCYLHWASLARGGSHHWRFSCTWSHFFHMSLSSCHSPHKSEKGRYYYHIGPRVSPSKCNVLIGAPRLVFFFFYENRVSLMMISSALNVYIYICSK